MSSNYWNVGTAWFEFAKIFLKCVYVLGGYPYPLWVTGLQMGAGHRKKMLVKYEFFDIKASLNFHPRYPVTLNICFVEPVGVPQTWRRHGP